MGHAILTKLIGLGLQDPKDASFFKKALIFAI